MNRAERRQAEKKPPKPNRSKHQLNTYFDLEIQSFEIIEAVFERLRNGVQHYIDGKGIVFKTPSGEYLDADKELYFWCKAWREIAEHFGIEYVDEPLTKLFNKVHAMMQIDESAIDLAYMVVKVQRQIYRAVDKDVIGEIVARVERERLMQLEIKELIKL